MEICPAGMSRIAQSPTGKNTKEVAFFVRITELEVRIVRVSI